MSRTRADRGPRPAVSYDPTGVINGFPTYPRRGAPAHLKTRRQLSAAGLRPGGHSPVAQLVGAARYGRITYLYDARLAKPQFTLTAAKLAAVWTAARARRVCTECGPVGYIPREGICEECREAPAPRSTNTQRKAAGWTGSPSVLTSPNTTSATPVFRPCG